MAARTCASAFDVAALLNGLVNKHIIVKNTTKTLVTATPVCATYAMTTESIGGVFLADIAVAASLGCALALVPAAVAVECVKKGKLTPELAEYFHEVVNVCSRLFMIHGGPHMKLDRLIAPPEMITSPLLRSIGAPGDRADYDVTVPGFPAGKLVMCHFT